MRRGCLETMEILTSDIDQIAQWGMEAGYVEICGVLLTRSDGGPRLARVPNRADYPVREIAIDSDDFMDGLLELTGNPAEYLGDLADEIVVWHTHPGGLVGPSDIDKQARLALGDTRCLVVTIPSGEAVIF